MNQINTERENKPAPRQIIFFSTLAKFMYFEGRSSRLEFWSFTGIYLALILAGLAVDVGIQGRLPEELLGPISTIIAVVFFLPNLTVTVRRLHDVDASGWFYLIHFIPLVGPFIVMGFTIMAGTVGPNRFGEDPYAAKREASLPVS